MGIKNRNLIIIFFVIIVLALGALLYLTSQNRKLAERNLNLPAGIEDISPPQNQVTTVEIGSAGTSKGVFEKVESGEVYYKDGVTSVKLPLTIDEIVVACTDQNFTGATELNFDLVTKINVYNNESIVGKIQPGEVIVLFATEVDGVTRVHSIAVNNSSASCAQ